MLTVILSTWNGARTLPSTLQAMERLDAPAGGWTLVVVDNASTDETPGILSQFRDRLPLICLSELRRGKNRALNTGLRACQGDLVVFTDDDVLPGPAWLTRYREAADAHRGATVFGGPVLLKWEQRPPDWLVETIPLEPAFAYNAPRGGDGPMVPEDAWGNNLAVRHVVFQRGVRFCEEIGPGPGNYIMGSEHELLTRLAADGHNGWFVNEAQVQHIVRSHQLTLSWLSGRAYRLGRHLCDKDFRKGVSHISVPRLCGFPRWAVREQATGSLRWLHARISGDLVTLSRQTWAIALRAGYMAEFRRRSPRSRGERGEPSNHP